ncbi:MAG: pilus assembly protein N-terminal domain-containing protein [Hyphomicrobiales bacterium]|nr:pilus assembly protein N-terminal domain-containing protein [Hyphomicrobiales bacterium]
MLSITNRSRAVLLALAILPAAWIATASADTLHPVARVKIDQATLVKVPDGVHTLVIGNPAIADVTLLKRLNTLVVTGKSYGETNVIALDSNGNQVATTEIQVSEALHNKLLLQNGMDRMTYYCNPHCQPTVTIGDQLTYNSNLDAQINQHNNDSLQNSSTGASAQQSAH